MNAKIMIAVAALAAAAPAFADWTLSDTVPDGDQLVLSAQITGKVLRDPSDFHLELPKPLVDGQWVFNTRRWETGLPDAVDVTAEAFDGAQYMLSLVSKTAHSQLIDAKVRFALAKNPARQPPVGRLILLAPRPGPVLFTEDDALLIRWASTGTAFRVRVVPPSGAAFTRVVHGKELPVPMAAFAEDGTYALSLEEADDNLVFGEPQRRSLKVVSQPVTGDRLCPDCRGRGIANDVERCSTCSGSGQIAAGKGSVQTCPYCAGKGERQVKVICNRCNGVGRLNDTHQQRTVDLLRK